MPPGTVKLSEKYRQAVRMGKPVLLPAWVHACASSGKLPPQKDFLLPPLAGTTVCLTGVPVEDRAAVKVNRGSV